MHFINLLHISRRPLYHNVRYWYILSYGREKGRFLYAQRAEQQNVWFTTFENCCEAKFGMFLCDQTSFWQAKVSSHTLLYLGPRRPICLSQMCRVPDLVYEFPRLSHVFDPPATLTITSLETILDKPFL